MNSTTSYFSTPIDTRPLVWKGDTIPGYYIRNDGVLFQSGVECSRWKINGRNYSNVYINNHRWTYRIDYMVAYTFIGMREDAIRLIHVNGDITDDHIDNLVWYRKIDVMQKYKDLVIIEDDGSIREEWRPCITEHNPFLEYEVSNLGMIRDKDCEYIQIHDAHGYRVFYYLDAVYAKQTRMKSVHRAVAEAFIPNPNGYELINHLDGNKFNDVVYNLEWATLSMNAEHGYLQGLTSRNGGYTCAQIETTCKLLADGLPHVQITGITGVDRKTISDIYRGRRWGEISSKYKMPEKKWTPEIKQRIEDMIIAGMKGREIYQNLRIKYDQSAISLYERLRRELKSKGKI